MHINFFTKPLVTPKKIYYLQESFCCKMCAKQRCIYAKKNFCERTTIQGSKKSPNLKDLEIPYIGFCRKPLCFSTSCLQNRPKTTHRGKFLGVLTFTIVIWTKKFFYVVENIGVLSKIYKFLTFSTAIRFQSQFEQAKITYRGKF